MAGLVRLTHPFPSLLNALGTVAIATLAGGGPAVALRLGASMLALQASIGTVNDLADVDADRGRKPGKPLPRGVVRRGEAVVIAAVGLILGLGLSAVSGVPTAVVAAVGVGLGYVYDVRLSRTSGSWLPLAAALPLVPIHAWLGATGQVPLALVTLVPVGILAGGGLALANGIADIERDRSAGVATAAVRLGGWAWRVDAVTMAAVLGLAWLLAPRPLGPQPASGDGWAAAAWLAAMGLGSLFVILGVALGRARSADRRERGWELQAAGVAIVGLAWVAGIAAI